MARVSCWGRSYFMIDTNFAFNSITTCPHSYLYIHLPQRQVIIQLYAFRVLFAWNTNIGVHISLVTYMNSCDYLRSGAIAVNQSIKAGKALLAAQVICIAW